jgi:ribosome biogenesis protein MAK21
LFAGTGASSVELRRLIEEETNSLFRLSHHDVFKIAIQALKLLYSFAKQSKRMKVRQAGDIEIAKEDGEGQDSLTDRYYRTLYELLLRVHLTKAAKLDEFFSLVFKSVKSDKNPQRVLAFVRRIL